MNMISTGAFLPETDASTKQNELVKKLTAAWEKKNSKTARAGGASLMALSLAACGGEDNTPFSAADVSAAEAAATTAALTGADGTVYASVDAAVTSNDTAIADAARAEGVASVDITSDNTEVMMSQADYDAAIAAADDSVQASLDALQATYDALKADYDSVVAPESSALTDDDTAGINADYITGSVGDDNYTATNATLDDTDVISDGTSTDNDTLTVTTSAGLTNAANGATVIGIENTVINYTGFAAATHEVNGIQGGTITVNNTSAGANTGTTVNNVNNGVNIIAGTGVTGTLTVDYNDAGGTITAGSAATVTVTDAGNEGVTINAGDSTNSINLDGAGESSTAGTANDAATVNGAGAVALSTFTADQVENITLSGNGAAATYTITGDPESVTLTGSQNVTIKIDADDITTETVTDDTTAGTTTTQVTGAMAAGNFDMKKISTDVVEIATDNVVGAGDDILVNSGQTITFTGDQASIDVVVNTAVNAAAANSLSLVADAATEEGAVTLTSFEVDGANTISLDVTNDADAATDLVATSADFTTGATVTITGAGAVNLGAATAKAIAGSDMTGKLTATLSANLKTVTSGSGSDALTGYDGDMTIDAGEGTDTLTIAGGITLTDNTVSLSGVDVLTIADEAAAGNNNTILTMDASQLTGKTLVLKTAAGTATADNDILKVIMDAAALDLSGMTVDTSTVRSTTLDGANGTGSGATESQTITGTNGVDTITLNGQNGVVNGGAGNDSITGGAGNDTLNGDAGTDTIDGGSGNDIINGGAGADYITGNAGNDTVDGGAGDDEITTGSGTDSVSGGDGADDILGGDGVDILDGNAGNDNIAGQAGADTISTGAGSDHILYATDLGVAESITTAAAAGVSEIVEITLSGNLVVGEVITITDGTATETHTVVNGDTLTTVAAGLVTAYNASAAAEVATATSSGAVITLTHDTANTTGTYTVSTTTAVAALSDASVSVSGSTVSGYDVVTDFSSTDTIVLGTQAMAGSAAASPTAATNVKISTTGLATFADADDTLAEKITTLVTDTANVGNNEAVYFYHGEDAFVYAAGGTAGGTTDMLVQLTGLADTSFDITSGDLTIL